MAGIVFLTSIYNIATIVGMWKYRHFTKYLAWHMFWILLTVVTYAFVIFVHVSTQLGDENCSLLYVGPIQISMISASSSGFFPALVRLFEKDLRIRVLATTWFYKAPDKLSIDTNQWDDSSFLLGGYDVPVTDISSMNYSGIFKSISAKVLPKQFIIDSVGALTYLFKAKQTSQNSQALESKALASRDSRASVNQSSGSYTSGNPSVIYHDIDVSDARLLSGHEKPLRMVHETIRVVEYFPEDFQQIRDIDKISNNEILM